MDTGNEPRQTPHGLIYCDKVWWVQVLSIILALALCPALGYGVSGLLGVTSENGTGACMVLFFLIFIFGYALWMTRVKALVAEGIGKGLMKFVWNLVLRRKMPASLDEVLPSEDQIARMLVRSQKAASSFVIVAAPVAVISSLVVAFIPLSLNLFARSALLFFTYLLYGMLLHRLGRRGYLPIMDTE